MHEYIFVINFNLPKIPQGYRSKKLWGAVKPLAALQPYTSSRSSYHGNGILMSLCIFLLLDPTSHIVNV